VDPPRIKLYGLFPLTRRRYVAQVVAALVLAAGLLVGWWFFRESVRQQFEGAALPSVELFLACWNALPVIVLVLVALQALEAFFVLRLFRRREADRAAEPPAPG
jgi:hypothetical protein